MYIHRGRESYSKVGGGQNLDICCAEHNQHAIARRVWEHAPRKILKITCSEIESEGMVPLQIKHGNKVTSTPTKSVL